MAVSYFKQPWFGVPERPRLILSWILALASAGIAFFFAWTLYDNKARVDGNQGHMLVDYGGQWLLGRMIFEGRGRKLYHLDEQFDVLQRFYPRSNEDPDAKTPDSHQLLSWFEVVEADDQVGDNPSFEAVFVAREHWGWRLFRSNIGGPLYPPLHAVLYAPFGLLWPQAGYRTMQVICLILVFVAGYLVHLLTLGRVWWPIAVMGLMTFPGFGGTINLGQNPLLTLTLLMLGWRQLQQKRPILAGICWGFLAYKPVWAVSFLLVPLLSRRWKMAGAMILTGILLGLFTLPFVGLQTWFDWLSVGRVASNGYALIENWVFLSRDLIGLPRRVLIRFPIDQPQPYTQLASVLGTILWLSVPAITTVAALWHRRGLEKTVGPAPSFLLLGAYLSCYHFIYYDAMQATLGITLLFSRRTDFDSQRLRTRFEWFWDQIPLILVTSIILLSYLVNEVIYHTEIHVIPWETFGVLLLWAWCGWTWFREPNQQAAFQAPINSEIIA